MAKKIKKAQSGYDLLEPMEKVAKTPPLIRSSLEGFLDKPIAPEPKKQIAKYQEIYEPKYEKYLDAMEKEHGYSYQGDNALKLKTGKFNRASVPKKLVEEAYTAASNVGIDPYLLYGMIGQESTFGGALDSVGKVKSKRTLVSGWNLGEKYNPSHPLRFLADKKVPGVKATKTFHGYEFDVTDEPAMEAYLAKNPKLRQQYIRAVQSKDVPKDFDQFTEAARFIKEKGFEKYNPGDKTYKDSVKNSMELLKKDPIFSGYVEEIKNKKNTVKPDNTKLDSKFQKGGVIEDNKGQWAHPGKVTKINSPDITMKGVPYPVLGVSDTGQKQMMMPEQDYSFDGKSVTEYPMINQNKGQLKKLKQLTEFKKGGKLKKAQNGYRDVTIDDYYPEGTGVSNPAGSGVTPIDAGGVKGALGKLGGIGGALELGTGLIQGAQMMKQDKKARKQAEQYARLSGVVSEAADIKPDVRRRYVRPEDMIFDPNQMSPSYGTGTNFLQLKKGGEIQNTYAPKTLYEGLEEIPRAQFGMQAGSLGSAAASKLFGGSGEQSGAGMLGSSIGNAVGKFIPIPGASAILGGLGGFIGGAFGAKGQKQTKNYMDEGNLNMANAAFKQGMQGQFSANMRTGGNIRQNEMFDQYAMGGALKTHWGGKAEEVSINPYLPGGGESVEFIGDSHKEGGIGVSFGKSKVEVEGGEPAVKLESGGGVESLTVFGDMKIPSYGVSEIGDPKAKGRKFKNYVSDLNEQENKQNKVVDKGTKLVNDADTRDPYELLAMNSGKAMMLGGDMKLKDIAQKKQMASIVQKAILETAEENNLEPSALAEGKFKKSKGNKTAQDGEFLQYIRDLQTMPGNKKPSVNRGLDQATDDLIKRLPGVLGAGQYPQRQYPLPQNSSITKDPINVSELQGYTPAKQPMPFEEGPYSFSGMNMYKPDIYPQPSEGVSAVGQKDIKKKNPVTTTGKKLTTPAGAQMKMIEAPSSNPFEVSMDAINPEGSTPVKLLEQEYASKTPAEKKEIAKEAKKSGLGVLDYLNAYLPYLRPSNQMNLDPNQLMGEMHALATNNLEPVQAQKYSPLLETPTKLSYQDALNENQADFNAMSRRLANNPEALASLAGQKYGANSRVIAEQERQNQDRAMGAYNRNRGVLNDATLKNLAIMDTQYQRQSQAKSNTKAVAQAALSSISDKIAKNKLENKTLGIYENLYNYRFGPQGRAWNLNAPAQFDTEADFATSGQEDDVTRIRETSRYDANNLFKGRTKQVTKDKAKKKANGAIVRSLK